MSAAPAHLPRPVGAMWQRLEQPTTSAEPFDPSRLDHLPPAVARWLRRAVLPGAPLRRVARLSMHGSIRVGRWMPFTAEQVLAPDGFIWAAEARRFPLRIRGFDRFSDDSGEMRWKLAGVVPVMAAAGSDITRSAAGRLAGETMLLPGAALSEHISWRHRDEHHATATVTIGEFSHDVTIGVDEVGRLCSVTLDRWGNPDQGAFENHAFGVDLTGERRVDGYVLPVHLAAGWWYGTERWSEGQFFRAEIDGAEII